MYYKNSLVSIHNGITHTLLYRYRPNINFTQSWLIYPEVTKADTSSWICLPLQDGNRYYL